MKSQRYAGKVALLSLLLSASFNALAGSLPKKEATNYLEQIEAKPKFTMHSTDVMGDKIDTTSGNFSFEAVDI